MNNNFDNISVQPVGPVKTGMVLFDPFDFWSKLPEFWAKWLVDWCPGVVNHLQKVSGKFGLTVENFQEQENVWKGSPVFPDGMFLTKIRVLRLQSHLWYQYVPGFRALIAVNGTDLQILQIVRPMRFRDEIYVPVLNGLLHLISAPPPPPSVEEPWNSLGVSYKNWGFL